MFDIAHRAVSAVGTRSPLPRRLPPCTMAAGVALRHGRLTADDTQRLILDCRYPAGWHPRLVLTVEDTLEQAREELADHPELPRLLADGCACVGDKWESYNDELWEAKRWAISLAKEYAADEGITLTTLDDEH